MSDKRRGFRNFFSVLFFGLSIIVITLTAALVLDEMAAAAKRDADFNYDSAVAETKREIARFNATFKNSNDSLKNSADSLLAPGKHLTVIGDEYHPEEIRDSLFTFHLNYKTAKDGLGEPYDTISSIVIYRAADQQKIQTVIPPVAFEILRYQQPFVVEDMNFDGYNDFRVLDFVMMYGQSSYHFWLYNPEKDLFEPDTALEKTYCARFDPNTKTIYSSCRLSGPFDIINQTYTWGNKTLVLQEEEELTTNYSYSNTFTMRMTKRINGKLVTRTKDFADPPITNTGQVIFDWDKLK